MAEREIRTGTGFDAHRFAAGRRLVIGGTLIDHEYGLAGHSDADVLCHAIADACLGGACLGDIGKHFPDNNPRWKDADSLELLGRVVAMLAADGWHIVHTDSTVLAERPKLAGYIDDMRAALAGALRVETDCVSVKATTVEGMGALGRSEGIAAMAVVTIERLRR